MAKIRCRYCHGEGHNIKGCPSMKEAAKAGSEKNWEDRSYMERIAMEKVADYTEANKNRACTYCRNKGHTRRTCQIFASHLATKNELEVRWRKGFAKFLADPSCPIKIGAYVTWHTWDDKKIHAILSGVNEKYLISEDTNFVTSDMGYSSSDHSASWAIYTIISAEEGTSHWGPQAGKEYISSVPHSVEGKRIPIPYHYYYEGDRHTNMCIDILSEGISTIQMPEAWVNKADYSKVMKGHRNIDDSRMQAGFDRIRDFLDKIGY